jgi:alpha-beta hydrolase superfamily lysophospholipase
MRIIAIIFLFFLASCSNLFFQPDRHQHYAPEYLGLTYKNQFFKSSDQTILHSWFFPQKKTKGLVVLFHGNAQNLSSHFLSVAWMVKEGYDVWVWDYRGYGLSQGQATTSGVYKDSLAALKYTRKLFKKRPYEKLVMIGQSLGGNILMRALEDTKEELPINLLVLDSTFASYRSMARSKAQDIWFLWPLQPVAWSIMSERFSGSDSVEKIDIPTLVIHSEGDPIVPYRFGKEIFDRLNIKKKWHWPIKNVGHISTLGIPKSKKNKALVELIESN